MDVKVAHTMPGRARLKVAEVKNNPALGSRVEERLHGVSGVQHASVNPVTGSVFLLYDLEELAIKELAATAGKPKWNWQPPEVDTVLEERQHRVGNGHRHAGLAHPAQSGDRQQGGLLVPQEGGNRVDILLTADETRARLWKMVQRTVENGCWHSPRSFRYDASGRTMISE